MVPRNGLVAAIHEVIRENPEVQRVIRQIPPQLGEILYYNKDTRKVSVKYMDPISNSTIIRDEIDVAKIGNIHGSIMEGDWVIITFPGGNQSWPVVDKIIPRDEYKETIRGSSTLKSSGGI
jgi:hypothetical protein